MEISARRRNLLHSHERLAFPGVYAQLDVHMPLVAYRYLLRRKSGDVSVFVRCFHNQCVAPIGERSCTQRILKANVGRCTGEGDRYIRTVDAVIGRANAVAIDENVYACHSRQGPRPAVDNHGAAHHVTTGGSIGTTHGRQCAGARLLAMQRVDDGTAFADRTHQNKVSNSSTEPGSHV